MARPLSTELAEKASLAEKGMKRCRTCKEILSLSGFGNLSRSSDGHQPSCKPCTNLRMSGYGKKAYLKDPEKHRAKGRAYYHKVKNEDPERHSKKVRSGNLRKYGLTVPDFEALLLTQKGFCAICKKYLGRGRDMHVDHDHRTGEVRGILCNLCNVGLGAFKDSPQVLMSAARYLSP